jgi:tetratricopeptide (TPR) repeat protein
VTSHRVEALEIFCCYASKDEPLRGEMDKHLSSLKREGKIKNWYDRMIKPGENWKNELDEHLERAHIILLLISADFIGSDYCYEIEMRRAMQRHRAGEALVIPIILRRCDWENSPFGELQALPKGIIPVTEWPSSDVAFTSIAKDIRLVVDELLATAPPVSASPQANASLPPSIPRPPAVGFVARRDAAGRDIVEQLQEELAPGRNQLVVLWGAGGVGKTTLAVEAVQALSGVFGRRIVWASPELRADLTLATLLDEIATQLGRADLRPLAFEPKEEQVRALLAEAHALVILDNFETITLAEQARCAEWLARRASCPALITTRQRLTGARNISIHAMTPEEAGELVERWIEREAHSPHAFEGLEREGIIEAAGRNPLVLQWVLARVDLAGEPGEVLEELMQGTGDAARRVFDSSFKLPQLGDDGRDALLALSLFVPDASRDALAEVAGFGADEKTRFNEAIMRLSSLWMVEATQGNKRLKIEGLTRELTKSHFSKDARADDFRQRFVAHFLRHAETHAKTTPEDFAALEAEKDNILSAMDVAFSLDNWSSVTRLMDGIDGLLRIHGYWDEAIWRGKQALESAQNLRYEAAVARFAHNTAITFQHRGELEEAQRLYNESLEIKKRLGNQSGIASTLHELGRLAQAQGDLKEARRLYNESLEINKRLDNQSVIASTLHELGRLAQAQGDLKEARRLYNESLEINKRLGNQSDIAITLHELGRLAQAQGDLEEAQWLYNESLEINERLGNQSVIASTLHELGRLAQTRGDMEEARRLYSESLEIDKRLGNQRGIASTLHELGRLAQAQGDLKEAQRLYNESLEIKKRLGNQSGIAITFHALAVLAMRREELSEARRLYDESLEIAKRLDDKSNIALLFSNMGLLAEREGNRAEAARLFNDSLSMFEKLGSPYAEMVRGHLERVEGGDS